MKKLYLLLLITLGFISAQGQLVIDGDSLVGNEWIDFGQDYFKFNVYEDGVYRITAAELTAAGIDLSQINGRDFQLYRLGEQVPIHTTRLGKLGEGDFIEFFGEMNRGELDKHHYPSEEDMLNPGYSLVTDTAAYFLTWKEGSTNRRFITIANNLSGSLPAPLPYYLHSEKINYNNWHYKPHEAQNNYVKYSDLVVSEGFGAPITNNRSITLPADDIYDNIENATFRVRFGINKVFHQIELDFNGTRYQDYNIANQYKVFYDEFQVPVKDLKGQNTISLIGRNGSSDRVIVSEAELIYPRKFDFKNQSTFRFFLENTGFRRYIEAQNFNAGSNPILIDLKNRTRREVTVEDGLVKISVEPRNSTFDYYLFNPEAEGAVKSVGTLEKMQWIDYASMDHDYVMITSERLFSDPENGGANWIQEYADYRSSEIGGNFNPVIVTVENLYDQFGYGIDRHFISVNNFANYVKKAWPSLEYFFVIGKGIEYPEYRTKAQQESPLVANYYVPAWGAPGADNLLFATKGNNYPIRPVGRIAASSPDEVKIYLDKVKRHDLNFDLPQTMEDKYWTKRLIHLSGGGNAGEQGQIYSLLQGMEDVISREKFGADVTTFRKTSTDPLQNSTSEDILNLIDGGVSMITFFGHSAVGTFDFSLEAPDKYNNADHLPLLISLGCYSGNIHVPSKTKGLSEAFVMEPEVGALAFLASSGTAYISNQGILGNTFYTNLTQNLYGESIGKALHRLYESFSDQTALGYVTLIQQMSYHGDPAIKFITHESPDYIVDYASIKTVPDILSTADDVYEILFDVVNLGSVSTDSITIAIEHIMPDGSIADTLYKQIRSPRSKSTITVKFINEGTKSVGENKIRIWVDSDNKVAELPAPFAEANNILDDGRGGDSYAYYISDNSAKPIYPREFGIATGSEITLKASTSNLFTPIQNYIFQIDTSALFENPLEEAVINSGGGLIEWKPSITFEHNVVYYWRITPEVINPVLGRIWEESSFIYLPNSSEGWNQSHKYQYEANKENTFRIMSKTKFEMPSRQRSTQVQSMVSTPDIEPYTFLDNNRWYAHTPFLGNRDLANVIVWEPTKLKRNINPESTNTLSWDQNACFPFEIWRSEARQSMIDLYNEAADSSTFILHFMLADLNSDFMMNEWEDSFFDFLTNIGATRVNELKEKGTVPYILVVKKGHGLIEELIGSTKLDRLSATILFNTAFREGEMYSEKIGPAKDWDKLIWKTGTIEQNDSIGIELYKINESGDEVLVEQIFENEYSLDKISAIEFPYLKLKYFAIDWQNRTSPDLEFWRVLYKSIPEFTFNTKRDFHFYNDTLYQGENLEFKSLVQNIAEFSSDSLLMEYSILGSNNSEALFYKKYNTVEKDDPVAVSFTTSTKELSGNYQFKVLINPNGDQPEGYLFNNLGIKSFTVLSDKENPLLDVTFDGQHIMDGDIVSANPEILISLTDNNQFFMLDDLNSFELKLLANGDRNSLITIPSDGPDVEFIPGNAEKNEAQIIYRPQFEDGFYTLFVQGKDASGNYSGDNEYAIEFRVINEKRISHVFNYPNPFSTATQFVFTLTGQIPQNMKIQIMTMSGKVVREITKEELGDVHVGINRTEYWWDGTDEFGDQLANGVYLYRVITKDDNGDIYKKYDLDKGQANSDSYFSNGIGKMVIIR